MEYTTEELKKMYEELKWQYDHEDKPLYKRHIGGKMISILQELKKRQ